MITVTQEMLNRIHTDSDIFELAMEMNVPLKDLDFAIRNKLAEKTECYGCRFLAFPPVACPYCSRGKVDMFEKYKEN